MVDTSKFTLDTPVKISVMTPGIYVPELQTYTPLESYASIDECISILNRGIEIEFPQQEKNEITEKIEDILLDYEEKKRMVRKTHGDVGTNVSRALETVEEINNSRLTPEEIKAEEESHIFDFTETANRIVNNLKNEDDMFRFNTLFNSGVDRIEEETKLRKARERNKLRKKEALELLTMETETYNKLANAGYTDNSFDEKYDSMDFYDVTPSDNNKK